MLRPIGALFDMDWLTPFFTYFPLYALFFLGVGIPWALVLLPRDEWRSRVTVMALGLALGPIFSTTWLFILGTWGTFEVPQMLTGIILMSIVGITLAWLRRYTPYREETFRAEPWQPIERLLLGLMVVGFVIHVWITLFWPFVQYDTLWTFGYNARVFLLNEEIPDWIGYYPQMVPLTYTYGQLFEGEFNDHVAKAAVPWFFLGSVLMAFVLGQRVWGKRLIGILTAALFMLMPTHLFWSGAGDLEHPVTLFFTGAVVFFVLAWRSLNPRYAVISGLLFAGAAWTKPTAGAFALGVILVILVTAARLLIPDRWRGRIKTPYGYADRLKVFRQKFTIAAITGLTSLPIGLMWYIRNVQKDLDAIVFPDDYWNDFAQRSGQEFGWLILILLLGVAMTAYRMRDNRRAIVVMLAGLGLFLLGTLPNALNPELPWREASLWNWVFGARPAAGRLSALEVAAIIIGLGMMLWQLVPEWSRAAERARSSTILTALLIAPFTVVWFWGYSYHFRLMLMIVPVLAAFVAALIDAWLLPFMQMNRFRHRTVLGLTGLLGVTSLFIASYLTLWSTIADPLTTDAEKYAAANPALMEMVEVIEAERASIQNRDPFVVTLDEKRLNFFFPDMRTIDRDNIPTAFDDLDIRTDLIIGGSHADFRWSTNEAYPNQLAVYMQLAFKYRSPFLEYKQGNIWQMPINPLREVDDGNNRFVAYEVYTPNRNIRAEDFQAPYTFEDVRWDFIQLHGLEVRLPVEGDTIPHLPDENGAFVVQAGQSIYLQMYWQRTLPETPAGNYTTLVHLVDAETGEIVAQRDAALSDGSLPLTLTPYPDILPDRRLWHLPAELEPGLYDLHIGWYDPIPPNLPRFKTYQDGEVIGDALVIEGAFLVQ